MTASSLPLALLALVALLLGVAVPFAPVTRDQPVVTWPRAGAPVADTLLPLVPYRPSALTVSLPCTALRAAEQRGGELLRTRDARATPTPGLLVAVREGRLSISSGAAPVLAAPVPAGPCTFVVRAGESGTTVTRDGTRVADLPGLLPPPVEKLQTDLAGAPAAGLAVEVRPDARFATSPTTLKSALLGLEVVLLAALLVLLLVRVARPRLARRPVLRRRPRAPDVVVVVVSLGWTVLGPLGIDDGWYLGMALDGRRTGVVGNTVGQFSVAENPFVLNQYLQQLWTADGWSLLSVRLLAALFGLATYAALRRVLRLWLGPLSPRLPTAVRCLALAHLVWWLPYGLSLRPEPLLVLGSALVLLLAETARARRSVPLLAAAVAVAALATTASPSALVAWAPLALQVGWVRELARRSSVAQRVTGGLVLLAAASAAVPVAFADASLGTVLDTHATQRAFYPDLHWYDEVQHVGVLFRFGDDGAWGRRLPVLLSAACAVLAALAVGRARRRADGTLTRGPVEAALVRVAALLALGAALLSISPTKWVNHYGALAAFGTLALALAMLRAPLFAARWSTAARAAALGLLAAAFAASFAGPNLWRPITDWGQPFGVRPVPSDDRAALRALTPHLGRFYGSNLLLWVLAAGALVVLWRLVRPRSRSRLSARAAVGAAWPWLLRGGAAAGVLLLLAVFVAAPLRQRPGWSLAASNLDTLRGGGCGLADAVQVSDGGPYRPAAQALAGPDVLVDVKVRAVWPCSSSTTVVRGIAELPRLRVLAGEGLTGDSETNYRDERRGAVYTVLDREAELVALPARMTRPGPAQTPFGVIQRVDYRLPVAGYDLRRERVTVSGWTRGPSLAPEHPPGPV